MGKRETIDRTAHISVIAGMINPTNVRFAKSEDTILPHSLIFCKGYIITDGGALGSAYLDIEVPLERIIYDSGHGEKVIGDAVTVRLRANWKSLYRFKPEIPLCMTHKYYTPDGLFAGIQYMLRAIKRPVHYTFLDGEDRSWGFRWGKHSGPHPADGRTTHIVCEDRGTVTDSDNTLCLMSNSFFEAILDLTAEPLISTVGPDGYDLELLDQAGHLGVFEGIKAALADD